MAYRNFRVTNRTPMSTDGVSTLTVQLIGAGSTKGEQDQVFDIVARREWSEEDLLRAVNDQANRRNASESFIEALTLNAAMPLVKPALAQTQAQIDRAALERNAAELRFMRQLQADGVTTVTAAANTLAGTLTYVPKP